MRLLEIDSRGKITLTEDLVEKNIPDYAILSHTWGADNDEITFKDLDNGLDESKPGYAKIRFCGEQAQKDGLRYFWVDTCCINKADLTELTEAITSMFRWYRHAKRCYVYLSDVFAHATNNQTGKRWKPAFRKSRWFRRGWTLQELIAPELVEFFSQERELLGSKKSLEQLIHEITEIPIEALRGSPLSNFSVDERLSWAAKRYTKRNEDNAYCLLGIFDVYMPLIYGEGDNAFIRLKKKIDKSSKRQFDEVMRKSLENFKITDPAEDIKRTELSKDYLLEDCSKWILQDPDFQTWHGTDTVPLLWINGDPGKGKTMLMIALVRWLVSNAHKNSSAVTFFFCQSTDIRLNNASAILRGLIWKLAETRPWLTKHIHEKYDKQLLNNPNSVISLFSILSAMLDDCPRTFLLVDALDECNSRVERDQLIDLIKERATSSSKAKWLLASRNHFDIKLLLEQESRMLSLELNELHISQAVRVFVEEKTRMLARKKNYGPILEEKVKQVLITKADSTFLWVALACKSLVDVTRRDTLSTLDKLSPGLKPLYARMMDLVLHSEDEKTKDLCLRILRSASLALRPLAMEELVIVAGLPSDLLNDDISDLTDFCGSFVTIRDNVLYFVHQSAKDYLVGEGSQKLCSAGLLQEHSLVVSRSLDAMSRILKKDVCDLRHPSSPPSKEKIHTRLRAVSYACSFWVEHLGNYLNNSINSLLYEAYLKDQGRVHKFLLKHLLHWFEALSLIGEINRGIIGLHSLERVVGDAVEKCPNVMYLGHQSLIHDAIRVLRQFRPAVEEAPLQVYCSTLIFSPENSIVRQTFTQDTPHWVSTRPRITQDWSPCLQTLEGHMSSISSVVYSPDGRQLASSSRDHTVRLWDAATGACLQTLEGHTDSIYSVVYSPDGRQLASSSRDHTVRLWDAATGVCLQTLEGHTDSIYSVVYSLDGQQLASGSFDHTIRLWEAATGACLQILEGHTDLIYSVVYSPDGRQLASASHDDTVRLWDTASGVSLHTLEGHTGSIYSVVYSLDGRQLASGSLDHTVRLWDVTSGACVHTLEGHTDCITSVVYSPDGRQLASGSIDNTIRLWDMASGTCLHTLEGHTFSINSVIYSPDGRQLVSGSHDDTVRLWDVATGACLHTLEGHTGSIKSVVSSPDGRQLASSSLDATVRLWDAASGACPQALEGHTRSINSVVYSPDGRQLASSSDDSTVRLWDVASGVCLKTLEGHTRSVKSVVYSLDGQQLASGSHDRTVRLWDVATGACLHTLEGHTDSIQSVVYSIDGRQLASGSRDHTVRLWDVALRACLKTLKGHTDSIDSVIYSSDGRQLASGSCDHTLRVWDVASGTCLQTLKGHTGSINSVAYSPDGRRLVSGSHDDTVRLWDIATGACLQTLEGYTNSIAFSPDDFSLVTDFGVFYVGTTSQVDPSPKLMGCGIEHEKKWITWRGNNVLWLPTEYRPRVSTAKESCITIGCQSGVVYILNFCTNNLPP